jgi:anti-sigma B factor antagonist
MKSGLTISQSASGPVQVVKLAGFLDGHTFVELEKHVDALIKAGKSRIVIELSGLSYIASAGVGCFIGSAQHARKAGGSLQLVNPSPNVREIFTILGLESVFTIHDTVDAGVKAAQG